MVVRFFMMQAHYRSELDFSSEALKASEKGFHKLMAGIKTMDTLSTAETSSENVDQMIQHLHEAMNDDFNTPILIANLFEITTFINKIKDGNSSISGKDLNALKTVTSKLVFNVLGLTFLEEAGNDKLEGTMEVILTLRKNARDQKDWGTSDLIRDKLSEVGIQIKDGKEGTSWTIS
jgi:cysteinyl-tRNA synthetase